MPRCVLRFARDVWRHRSAVWWLLLAACGSDPATEIEVFVDVAEGLIPRQSLVHGRLFDTDGALTHDQEVALVSPEGLEQLPLGVRVLPRLGDPARSFRFLAELVTGHGRFLGLQQARAGFSQGSGALRLEFDVACEGRRCLLDETCIDGVCVPACFTPSDQAVEDRTPPVACPTVPAGHVYVDSQTGLDVLRGTDPDCTAATSPCRNLPFVLAKYGAPGVVVNVRGSDGGERNYGPLMLANPIGGTAEEPLILRAWPGTGVPILDGGGTEEAAVLFCCTTNASGHVVIDGFRIRGGRVGVLMNGGSAVGNTIRHCTIEDNLGDAMAPETSGGITLLNDTADTVLEGNVIRNNRVAPDGGTVPGIRVGLGNLRTRIVGNVISENEDNGILSGGIDIEIRDNRIWGNGSSGILLRTGSARPVVFNNRICNNGSDGVLIGDSLEAVVQNNTVLGHPGAAVHVRAGGTGEVQNNILGGGQVGILFEADGTLTDSYNLFFENAGGDHVGGLPSVPTTDLRVDPGFVPEGDRAQCTGLVLRSDSMAVASGADGQDLGAD